MSTTTPSTRSSPYQVVNRLKPRFQRLSAVSRVDPRHDSWCDSNGADEVLKHHHELRVDLAESKDEKFQRLLSEVQEEYEVTIKRVGVYVVGPEGHRSEVSDQSEGFDTTVTRYRIIPE